jgi:hypothetical protein
MRSTLLFILIATCAAASARAQRARIVLTPFIGGYVPTTDLGSIRVPFSAGAVGVFGARMNAAPMFGARLGYWATERFGVEVSYFLVTSKVRVTTGILSANFDAEVQGASFKALYQLSNSTSGSDFFVSGGLGGVRHGGQAFNLVGSSTDLAGIIGPGVFITLSPQVRLRIDGDLMVYPWSAAAEFPSKTQVDLVVSAGMAIRLTR